MIGGLSAQAEPRRETEVLTAAAALMSPASRGVAAPRPAAPPRRLLPVRQAIIRGSPTMPVVAVDGLQQILSLETGERVLVLNLTKPPASQRTTARRNAAEETTPQHASASEMNRIHQNPSPTCPQHVNGCYARGIFFETSGR
ncbi:MAG: hypothetical protein H6643_10075 [Caldilineaceae bacterium]|nr:hypothetical protein [Caldilineaceae bacterium]